MAEAPAWCRLAVLLFLLFPASLGASNLAWAQASAEPASTEIHNALRGIKPLLDQNQLSPSGLSATLAACRTDAFG